MIACAVAIAYFPSYLSSIASHGKFSITSSFNNHHHQSASHSLLQWLEKTQLQQLLAWFINMQVPKSYFTHFYITGSIVSLCLLTSNDKSNFSIPLCLFLLHVSRRLYECLYITIYGDSKIHLAGYLVGILHYVLVPISIGLINVNNNQSAKALTLVSSLSIVVFIIANIMQFRFHYILFLAKLKMKSNHHSISGTTIGINGTIDGSKDKYNYPLPEGIGFDSVCCPHYTAEIIIYLSLWMMDMYNYTAALVFLWVVANLSVVANLQFQWYKEQYGHELMVKRKHWKRLIPGGW